MQSIHPTTSGSPTGLERICDPLSSKVQGFIDVNTGRSANPLLFFQLTKFDDNLEFRPWNVVMFAAGYQNADFVVSRGLRVCLNFKSRFRLPHEKSNNETFYILLTYVVTYKARRF